MNDQPKSPGKNHDMKRHALTILAALFATSVLAADIPPRVQKKILAFAPGVDSNSDGTISTDELQAAGDKLPEDLRAMLGPFLNTQGDTPKDSEPAKHKTTLPKPPASNGSTPFIDPIFKHEEIKDITYGTAKSGDATMPLLLDVYRPVATAQLPEKLPVMLLSFGGGWRKGSKEVKYIRDLCAYYAARGYVAISMQYRIAKDNPPAEPGPAPLADTVDQARLINAACQDTCNAIRWIKTNAGKYQIDPNRIAIGGVSAGAFNSLHAGLCAEEITGPDAKVAAVISLMGAVTPNHIDPNDPPVFIAHGTSDKVAPYFLVKTMVQQLENVKARYSFYPVEGVAHRLEAILNTEFEGKTVKAHSLDFCFEAMKLRELLSKE
jgi:acetyl esterase/lipase